MKHKTTLVLMLFITFLFLVSCNNKHKNERIIRIGIVELSDEQNAAFKALVAEYEDENDCSVEFVKVTSQTILTKMQKGECDIIYLPSYQIATLDKQGYISDLQRDSLNIKEFNDWTIESSCVDGQLKALPFLIEPYLLFENTTLIQKANIHEPALTLDELVENAYDINKNTGKYGFGAVANDEKSIFTAFKPFLMAINENSSGFSLISPQTIAALNYYCDISHSGIIDTKKGIESLFMNGEIGYCIASAGFIDRIKKTNPSFKLNVCPLPKGENGSGIGFSELRCFAICSKSRKQALAQRFIQYCSVEQNTKKYFVNIHSTILPPWKKISPELTSTLNYKEQIIAQVYNSRTIPALDNWSVVEAALNQAITSALLAECSPEAALWNAQIAYKLH